MDFVAMVQGEKFVFSFLSKTSFLISGNNAEYILYKTKDWHCADEIGAALLDALGETIDEHMHATH